MKGLRWFVVIGVTAMIGSTLGLAERRTAPGIDDPALAFKYSIGYLSGVWLMTLTLPDEDLANCPGNALLPEEAYVLGNFTRDGAFLSSSDLPALQAPLLDDEGNPVLGDDGLPVEVAIHVGHGHGTWVRTGITSYSLDSWRMATVDGQMIGLAKGHSDVNLDLRAGTMTGDITLQLLLGLGIPLPPACGTLVGTRLED